MSEVQPVSSTALAIGLEDGAASLLDVRCGDLAAAWQAHSDRITAVAADGSHQLVTASQVGGYLTGSAEFAAEDSFQAPSHLLPLLQLTDQDPDHVKNQSQLGGGCCAQDRKLKLWDLRMLMDADTSALPMLAPRCLHTFGGHKHSVTGCTVHLVTFGKIASMLSSGGFLLCCQPNRILDLQFLHAQFVQ